MSWIAAESAKRSSGSTSELNFTRSSPVRSARMFRSLWALMEAVFTISACALNMPDPASPAMFPVVAFCWSKRSCVVSLASMWNISLALISPSSTTMRLIPMRTIVASVC
jgi:hypothetical protein